MTNWQMYAALLVAVACVNPCRSQRVLFVGATQREIGAAVLNITLDLNPAINPVVLTRNPARAERIFKSFGKDVEIIFGSSLEKDDVAKAAKGAHAIWFLTPAPQYTNNTVELQCAEAVIECAKLASVERVILGVSNGPVFGGEDDFLGRGKAEVERMLRASELNWASIHTMFLAESVFLMTMDLMTAPFGMAMNPNCYPSEAKVHFTTLRDVARASVKLIQNPKLQGVFAVGDPTKYTHQEVNSIVNKVAGYHISCLPFNVIGAWMRVLLYFQQYFDGKTATLMNLLYRIWDKTILSDPETLERGNFELLDDKPTTIESFFYEAFGKTPPKKEEL